MANTLYLRTTPEIKAAVLATAEANRRKINAQLELILEEWLRDHGVQVGGSSPAAPDHK